MKYSIKTLISHILFSILFVLVLFTPPIRFLPYYTWVLALVGVWTLTDKNYVSLIGFKSSRNRRLLKYCAFVIVLNSVFVPLLHGGDDFSYIPLQIGIILTLCRNLLLVYCLHKYCKGDLLTHYARYFFTACCIYVGFTLSFIVLPEFKVFWLDTMLHDVKDMSQDFAVYEFRYSLDGFAAFSSASVFSFACLFCCYYIAVSHNVSIARIACLMLMVIGCFFYGRVSLVGMLLGSLLIAWASGSMRKTIRVTAIIVAFVLGLLAILNVASQTNDSLLLWQDWAFSIVKQLFVEKKVTDYSVTHMVEDMYYMPDFDTLLLGDGRYTNANGSYYGHTDVGFMRLTLYGGLISLSLVYTLIIKLSKTIIKCTQSVVLKRFLLLATVLFFVLEMKGESYQRALMMLYPIFLIVNYKNNISFLQNESKS